MIQYLTVRDNTFKMSKKGGKVIVSYKEKLQSIKTDLLKFMQPSKGLPTVSNNTNLADLDNDLESLLGDTTSFIQMPIEYTKEVVRLIIILDISGSMKGTEEDIYFGLKRLITHHKEENILLNLVVFNGERKTLLDDVYIGNVNIPNIEPNGSTNLSGSLYYTMKDKCREGVNLTVVLSDGSDNINEVSAETVHHFMKELRNNHNHFYFLGEPHQTQTAEEVYISAQNLGFGEENISIFTRKGNGNRLNFEVISKMLDELLEYGSISKEWSEPIKSHYLALMDKRC